MTKVIIMALLICFTLTGLMAIELDYHVGAGLTVPFIESTATFFFPQAYGGLGVNLIPQLALGAEYEVFGLYFFGYGFLMHMPKAYVKFDMNENFTLSALGGVAIPSVFSPDSASSFPENNVGVAGIRATLFFLYGEYLFLVNREAPISALSVGVAVKK